MTAPDPQPPKPAARPAPPAVALEFLPDAEELALRPVPRAARATLWLLLALIAGVVAWATLSELDEIVVARGRLVTSDRTVVAQPLETSVIRALDVRVGQFVKKGERLALLDPTFAQADVSQLEGRAASLGAQVQRLEAELHGGAAPSAKASESRLQADLMRQRQANHAARLAEYAAQLERLRTTLDSTRREQDVLEKRVASLAEIERMRSELLSSQSGPKLHVLESRQLRLEVESDLASARTRLADTAREVSRVEAERNAYVQDWRTKAAEERVAAQRDLDSAAEQLSKAQRRRDLVTLTAPVDGVVLQVVQLSVGSVVKEAEPLVTLVPADAPLEAEVQIEARDIGYVRVRDASRVKVDAFPFQKHGTLAGSLDSVSGDSLARRESSAQLAAMGAAEGGEAYYVGRVRIPTPKLNGLPAEARLLPGMTVTAEIIVGRRTILSYFTYPLVGALDRSLREP